jgi:predicted enzyme related to lactoylglutathione lyase
MASTINWFEIPVTDFERTKKFYENILSVQIKKTEIGSYIMGFLPAQDRSDVTGAIVFGEGYVPSDKGVLIYLNGGDDLNNILSKVENAGGKILVTKTLINEDIGFYGIFFDTEGNKIALHSSK